jgi:hypothetical protein
MFDLNNLIFEFDEVERIVHLTAGEPIRCSSREQGYALARAVKEFLQTKLGGEKGYLITDYSKIIIEPKFVDEYAAVIKEIFDTYLHPGGYARYGFEISRVTAQLGHSVYLGSDPNLYNSREEAYQFIHNLISQNSDLPKFPNIGSQSPEINPMETETVPVENGHRNRR